jgi:hypothetical protein
MTEFTDATPRVVASQLHSWVAAYNWDDGLPPIRPIVDSPATEFATALMIYWRLGGPLLEGAGVNAEAKQLQDLVRERLLAGLYPRGDCQFDLTREFTPVQFYRFRKAGVPELLLGQPRVDSDSVNPRVS